MWILTGPFDFEEATEGNLTKRKALKTGREYSVGRRNQPLVIRDKRVSKKHATFLVADCSEGDVLRPETKPRLSIIVNGHARRLYRVTREEPYVLNPSQQFELEDGDTVELTKSNPIAISVKWEPLCCYCPLSGDKIPVPLERCAELGITITTAPSPSATHHLSPTFTLEPALASSLISLAHLVKPQWLTDLLTLAEARPNTSDDDDGEGGMTLSPLERTFSLPPTQKYRPVFSSSLPGDMKQYMVWEPDEGRMGLFRGVRVVFIGEKGREAQEAIKEVVKRGGGQYECFAVEGGRKGLHKVLAKAAGREGKVILVAEEEGMIPAVGEDAWNESVDEMSSFGLSFVPSTKLIEAVVRASISELVDNPSQSQPIGETGFGSPLPDVIPNTYQDEPSIPPDFEQRRISPQSEAVPMRRLPRRATSRSLSRAASPLHAVPSETPAQSAEEAPKTRRTLVRRAGRARTAILGIDEPSEDLGSQPMSPGTTRGPTVTSSPPRSAEPPSIANPTPGRTSRLKRRAGTQLPPTQLSGLPEDESLTAATEPPLKKFRALFDESDPDRVAQSESRMHFSSRTLESLTQSDDTQQRSTGHRLVPVLEEEESSGQPLSALDSVQGTQGRDGLAGRKRKSPADETCNVEVDEAFEQSKQPRAKKRAVDGVTAAKPRSQTQQEVVQPTSEVVKPLREQMASNTQKPRSKPGVGAAPGKPDRDDAFLKAVASTKKGKRTEDTFDREFNNLRISKPDLEHEIEQKEWDVLENFGDDQNIRGNFVVIVEMEVPERRREANLRRGDGRTDWEGKPDFKKFRRKNAAHPRRPVVELAVETQVYGLGSQYEMAASQDDNRPQLDPWATVTSDRPNIRTSSQLSSAIYTFPPSKLPGKFKASVVAESDEELVEADIFQPSAAKTRCAQHNQKTQKHQKSNQLFIDSDEDLHQHDQQSGVGPEDEDEVSSLHSTAKSTGGGVGKPQLRTQGSRKKYVVVDDDSDDDGTFRGFGSRRR